jgi:nucleoid-associated protein Lsr2
VGLGQIYIGLKELSKRYPDARYTNVLDMDEDMAMATKTMTVTTDDLDGSEGAKTVSFALQNVTYEVDLSAANLERLKQTLAPYIAVARRPSSRRGARGSQHEASNAVIRQWAIEQGLEVSSRGRVGAPIVERYRAAH